MKVDKALCGVAEARHSDNHYINSKAVLGKLVFGSLFNTCGIKSIIALYPQQRPNWVKGASGGQKGH